MDFAPAYLAQRFVYRIGGFFRHWYADASRMFMHAFVATLESLDQTIAFRMTAIHFFEPLYKDYSAVGRIVGVVFRSGRLMIGAVIYAIIIVFFAAIYVAWLAVPPVAFLYVIAG